MAQKNTLRYVILGLLSKEPMAGYDIKKAFEGGNRRFLVLQS